VAKRLLTDPAPELRSSLKNLLFREDQFRWNRLENLLRNAKGSMEYDLSGSLDQAIDFLFSERGEFIRDRVAQELINSLDTFGQQTVDRIQQSLRRRLGMAKVEDRAIASDSTQTLDHIQRIWGLLRETEGVDVNRILPLIPKILAKPETQQLGQQVVGGVAQKALARFIREVLLAEPPVTNTSVSLSSDLVRR
jgi:hypothetical protein